MDPDPHWSASNWNVGSGSTSVGRWQAKMYEYESIWPLFKALSLYLEARVRIRIRIKVKCRIRIRIKVTNRIRVGSASTWCGPQHCLFALAACSNNNIGYPDPLLPFSRNRISIHCPISRIWDGICPVWHCNLIHTLINMVEFFVDNNLHFSFRKLKVLLYTQNFSCFFNLPFMGPIRIRIPIWIGIKIPASALKRCTIHNTEW